MGTVRYVALLNAEEGISNVFFKAAVNRKKQIFAELFIYSFG